MSIQFQDIVVVKITKADNSDLALTPTQWTNKCATFSIQWHPEDSTAKDWAFSVLSTPTFPNLPTEATYCIYALATDTENSNHSGVELMAHLLTNPETVLGVGTDVKFTLVNRQEAAAAFTNGDAQMFIDLMRSQREQRGLA